MNDEYKIGDEVYFEFGYSTTLKGTIIKVIKFFDVYYYDIKLHENSKYLAYFSDYCHIRYNRIIGLIDKPRPDLYLQRRLDDEL